MDKKHWLSGPSILPDPIAPGITAADLVERAYLAYNGGRLREACELYTKKMLADDGLVGMSLTGALTPAVSVTGDAHPHVLHLERSWAGLRRAAARVGPQPGGA